MKNKKTILTIILVVAALGFYMLDKQMGWGILKSFNNVDTYPIAETEYYRAELLTFAKGENGQSNFTLKLTAKTDFKVSHLDASVVYYESSKRSGSRSSSSKLLRIDAVDPFSLMDGDVEMESGESREFNGYVERSGLSLNSKTLIVEVDGYLIYPGKSVTDDDFDMDAFNKDLEEIDKVREGSPDNNQYDFLISAEIE